MAIRRISDTVLQSLPAVILDAIKTNDKSSALDTESISGTSKFRDIIDKVFPVMSIISYDDIENELRKYSETEMSAQDRQTLIAAVKEAVQLSKALCIKMTIQAAETALFNIVNDNRLSIGQKVSKAGAMFSKGVAITDPENIAHNADVILASNFAGIASRINTRVNTVLKKQGSTLKFGDYLNLGHSAARLGDSEEYAFNSPKLAAVLFDISNTSASSFLSNTVDLNRATNIYATKTEQLEYAVTVTKEFGDGFLNIFMSVGGSVTILENAKLNQLRGSRLERNVSEKFGKNDAVLKRMVAGFKHIKDTAVTGLYNNSDLAKIIRSLHKYAGSPSGVDHIVNLVSAGLTGVKAETFKGKDTSKKRTKVVTKTQVVVGTHKNTATSSVKLRTVKGQFTSLISLQTIINSSLQEQIRKNMGTGENRNVLNYRSGRLAGSANVERMSQSREGMITAFYSYMRNPYGTFSEGGAQQDPRSRDPKLLISKSIREIAAKIVGNRMRAVLI